MRDPWRSSAAGELSDRASKDAIGQRSVRIASNLRTDAGQAGDNSNQINGYTSQDENAAETDEKQKACRMGPVESNPFNG